ncbi:MAG: DUF2779 domain-containing protein, partial [Candidatus Margulisiibacteriota bacterium]
IPIGPYCNSPYACQFKSRCWSGISSPSVFDVVDLPIQRKFEYFFSNKIQIDNLEVSDFNHVKQKRQIACELESLDFVNLSKLRSFIKGVSGPISFLDFESFQMPIPPFDGLSPYESIPFMFSVHVLDNNHLIDNQFIASPNVDPRLEVIKSLLSLLPANGSILVFNKSSELNILDRLILYAPSYSEQILSLKYRLVDLQLPFKHQWLYMRAFNGSCSIKSILPAIDPSYSYDALEVSSGRLINMFYKQYLKSSDKTIVDKLKAYVKLDTYSMVVIYKFISRIIG